METIEGLEAHEELRNQCKAYEAQIAALEAELLTADAFGGECLNEIEGWKERIAALEEKLIAAHECLDRLHFESQAQVAALEAERDEALELYHQVVEDVAREGQHRADILNELAGQRDAAITRFSLAEAERDGLRKQLDAESDAQAMLRDELDALREELRQAGKALRTIRAVVVGSRGGQAVGVTAGDLDALLGLPHLARLLTP